MDIEAVALKAKAQLPKKVESKDATPAPSAEIQKTKDEVKEAAPTPSAEDKVKLAEEQVKKDEEILSKKDEELKDDEKARKVELDKVKETNKDKDEKSNIQKRFDELTLKIRTLEADKEATKAEKDSIKTELDGIKKQLSMTPQDVAKEKVKGELNSRKAKYLDEDKSKPREDRREMDKPELDEWLLEDYEGASEWITKRTIRRHEEERELQTNEHQLLQAEQILDKQHESAKRTYIRHPELQIGNRQQELLKEGKTKEEALAIICKEVPMYGKCVEIYKENPNKYMLSETGPEDIMAEYERRSKPEVNNEVEKIRKELAEARAEVERLKNLDTGISSTRGSEPQRPKTEIEKQQIELAKKVGLDPEKLKKRIAERALKGYDV